MKTKRLFFSVACLAATLAFGSTALCDGNDSAKRWKMAKGVEVVAPDGRFVAVSESSDRLALLRSANPDSDAENVEVRVVDSAFVDSELERIGSSSGSGFRSVVLDDEVLSADGESVVDMTFVRNYGEYGLDSSTCVGVVRNGDVAVLVLASVPTLSDDACERIADLVGEVASNVEFSEVDEVVESEETRKTVVLSDSAEIPVPKGYVVDASADVDSMVVLKVADPERFDDLSDATVFFLDDASVDLDFAGDVVADSVLNAGDGRWVLVFRNPDKGGDACFCVGLVRSGFDAVRVVAGSRGGFLPMVRVVSRIVLGTRFGDFASDERRTVELAGVARIAVPEGYDVERNSDDGFVEFRSESDSNEIVRMSVSELSLEDAVARTTASADGDERVVVRKDEIPLSDGNVATYVEIDDFAGDGVEFLPAGFASFGDVVVECAVESDSTRGDFVGEIRKFMESVEIF